MKTKKYITVIIIAATSVFSMFLTAFLPGVIYEGKVDGSVVPTTVSLVGMMFGSSELYTVTTKRTIEAPYIGGLSTFGLVAFIMLALSLLCVIIAIVIEKNSFVGIGAAFSVLAGIAVLFILVGGTNITAVTENNYLYDSNYKFSYFFNGFKLGAGTIIFSILNFTSGLVSGILWLLKTKEQTKQIKR